MTDFLGMIYHDTSFTEFLSNYWGIVWISLACMIRTPSKYSVIISPDKINDTTSSLNKSNWTETFLLLVEYENRFIWWPSSDHRQVWWLLNSCDTLAMWSKGLKKNNARTYKGFQIDILNKISNWLALDFMAPSSLYQ